MFSKSYNVLLATSLSLIFVLHTSESIAGKLSKEDSQEENNQHEGSPPPKKRPKHNPLQALVLHGDAMDLDGVEHFVPFPFQSLLSDMQTAVLLQMDRLVARNLARIISVYFLRPSNNCLQLSKSFWPYFKLQIPWARLQPIFATVSPMGLGLFGIWVLLQSLDNLQILNPSKLLWLSS